MSRLYVIPTPIGNLEDVTLRALRILKEVDLILAEDTRTSGIFLKHYNIQTPMRSHHAFNEHARLDQVIDQLKSGTSIALISDAGTPGISDPGFLLIRACIAEHIPVETLPGPTACIPALVNSGLPTDSFLFVGFLPAKKGRETKLKSLAAEKHTLIFYESPHRLLKTLHQFLDHFGDRRISISREISKKFEETVHGNTSDCIAHFTAHPPKGEFVLVLAGAE